MKKDLTTVMKVIGLWKERILTKGPSKGCKVIDCLFDTPECIAAIRMYLYLTLPRKKRIKWLQEIR
jgi:hypothetical protein